MQDYLRAKNERDYVLFVLGITTGYRAGDLVTLKVRDVIRAKNRKAREAEILPELEKVLMKYIKYKEDYEYMFPSRKGNHITVDRVTKILKEAASFFSLEDITAHSMRKTYAYTVYVESGYDILAVKEMLGHSSVEETKLYLGLDRELYHQYSQSLRRLVR